MPRFFVSDSDCINSSSITLTGEDARHISLSLRAKPGEKITVCDGNMREFLCTVGNITKDSVILNIDQITQSDAEPDIDVTLYQALIKSDKFDTVVQKAVELGVTKIVPVITERCVSKPDEKSLKKKIERWNKISREAAMQSGRGMIPQVSDVLPFEKVLSQMQNDDLSFMCYEKTPHIPIKEIYENAKSKNKDLKTFSFIIGPEGGFSEKEAKKASASGIPLASLGNRILRTETAPLCVLSCIMFMTDNLQ